MTATRSTSPGSCDLSTGTTGTEPAAQAMMDSFDVRISITFPGAVESATGEIDGNT